MTITPADRFNPFPGLRPFEAEDNHLFFGREEQVKALLSRLARQRFLAVVGTSGGGKSSLVRAGLLPALDGGFMVGAGSAWRVAVMRPGIAPIGHLAAALHGPAAFDPGAAGSSEAIDPELATLMTETTLRRGALGLIEAVRLERMERGDNLLIVVDQFEELFRFKQESARQGAANEAEAFVKLLLEASKQTELPIYIVLTMRSEYLGECSQFRDLPEALNDSQVLIPRLTRDQLRQAIEAPVKVGGASITPALVNRLLNDIGDNQDQLPVLQHALMRTWEHWQARGQPTEPIGLEDYLSIGGMERALSLHADEIYNGLASDAQRSIAATLFRCLTEKDSGGRGIRRPTRVREVGAVAEAAAADVIAIAEAFRAPGRTFLMPPVAEALDENSLLDLSHESLMRIWGKLNNWVEDEAQSAQTYRRLAETAIAHAKGEAAPLRDPELTIFGNWQQKQLPNAAWAERYAPGFDEALAFLRFSRNEHESELAEKERRREEESRRELEEANRARVAAEDRQRLLRRGLMGMGALSLVAVSSGVIAFSKFQEAKAAKDLAEQQTEQLRISNVRAEQEKSNARASEAKAKQEKDKAVASEKKALASQKDAELQKGRAEHQKVIADKQTIVAQQQAENATREKNRAETNQLKAEGSTRLAERNISLAYAATARALLPGKTDPFEAVMNGLAAMGRLAGDPGESIALTDILEKAVSLNWQIGLIATGLGEVTSLIELKNGELISAGMDGRLRRWRDGKPVGEPIQASQGPVRSLIALKNGELISVGSIDGSIRLWRDGTPLDRKPIPTGQGQVSSLIELKNGELISVGQDGSLRRWRDGKPVGAAIATGQGSVESLVELRNGELISGGGDGSLRRWRDGKPVGTAIATGQGSVESLIELRNGEVISGGLYGSIRRWRDGKPVGDGKLIPTGQGPVRSLLELKNGELISVGFEGSLKLWRDGKPVGDGKPIPTGEGELNTLIALKSGELISGGRDGSLRRWRDGKPVGEPIQTGQGPVRSLIELKNGELISGGQDGSLRSWRDGKPIGDDRPIPTGEGSWKSLLALKNGDLIIGNDDSLQRWHDGKAVGPEIATGQGPVISLIELKNGELISGGQDGSLRRWRDGKPVGAAIATGQGSVESLIELKNGEVISGGLYGSIRRWRDGKPVGDGKLIPTDQGPVKSLIELKNGELISVGLDKSLRRWRDGKPVSDGKRIPTGEGGVRVLIALKNGELITGGEDGSLRRWRDGKPVGAAFATGQGKVEILIELKNGELISGGQDGTLRRWRDGKPVGAAIATGQRIVESLIELKNGELISGGSDGTLKIFSPQAVIEAACQELREHPVLLDPQTAAERAARETCRSRGQLK
jgi:WD40 repeat protein